MVSCKTGMRTREAAKRPKRIPAAKPKEMVRSAAFSGTPRVTKCFANQFQTPTSQAT